MSNNVEKACKAVEKEESQSTLLEIVKSAADNSVRWMAVSKLTDQLELLINELIRIGQTDGYLSLQAGGIFDQIKKHIRTREIGNRLNEIGGIKLMREVGYTVTAAFPDSPRGRELEAAWVGIGQWQ